MRPGLTQSLLAACFFAPFALAAPPEILDHVPANTPAVVVIRSVAGTAEALKPLAEMVSTENDDSPIAAMKKLLDNPGFKKNGSVVMMFPNANSPHPAGHADADQDDMDADASADEPEMISLVEVTDYAKFIEGLGGHAGEGVDEVTVDGQPMFARKADGFAVLSPTRELVENFKPEHDQMKAHAARLGEAGARIADKADIIAVISGDVIRAHASQAEKGGEMDMMEQMAPGAGEAVEAFKAMGEQASKDMGDMVLGARLETNGYTMDAAGIMKPGSPSAEVLQKGGDSHGLLKSLPDQDFYFAGAVDMSSPPAHLLMKHLAQAKAQMGAGQEGANAMDSVMTSMDKADGVGFVVGANKAGPMAGAFVNTAIFIKTKDAKGLLEELRKRGESGEEKVVGTTKIKVDYKKDVAEASGVKFDAWNTTVTMDPNDPNSFMAGMMMQSLFGQPKGFGQMAAATGNGLVMTLSQNTPLMSAAIDAAKGGNGLAGRDLLSGVRSHLHDAPAAEMYIGIGTLLHDLSGVIAGYVGTEINVPANLPPVGLSLTTGDGALSSRLYVPMDVMKALGDVAKSMNQGGDELEPMDDMGDHQEQNGADDN